MNYFEEFTSVKPVSYSDSINLIGDDHMKFSPGMSFGDLRKIKFPPEDKIIHCLPRGFFGILVGVTNAGKSTLLRNLLINLGIGRPFEPLVTKTTPRRIAVIDNEETLDGLQRELNLMCSDFSKQEQSILEENILIMCDVRDLKNAQLKLSNPDHLRAVLEKLRAFKPDLIVVDTISSCFEIQDENSNAEVNRLVLSVLNELARLTNAAVLAAHHGGKAFGEYGSTREASHRGRGASAFGDQAKLILNLDRDLRTGEVLLSCGKAKGERFTTTAFRHDSPIRWYRKTSERMWKSGFETWLDKIVEGKVYSAVELENEATSESTGRRYIKDGVKWKFLNKVSHGKYEKVPKSHSL